MSGVDGVRGSSDPLAGAPIDLPRGGPTVGGEEGMTAEAAETTWHLAAEAGAAALEAAGLGTLGAAGGAVTAAVGWIPGLLSMGHATARAGVEGDREGLLHAAMGGDGSATSRAWGAGIAACMLDATSRELGALRDALPPGLRDDFEAGVAHAHEAVNHDAAGWMEARAEFRDTFRAYNDGRAAALGGWDDARRGEVFAEARREMSETLASDPTRASTLRAAYHAGVREGFVDADRHHVDAHRFEMDAAYRAGVTHYRSEEDRGSAALDRARASIVGFTAGSSFHAPISG